MKTLCMDSAHKYLVLVLLEDGKLVKGSATLCWKKQSEEIFPTLIQLMEEAHWDSDDLDEVVISDGPGSYTGVRIAMSIAKVLCTTKQLSLSCISTLQLYAGNAKDTFVMLDARSQRAYCAKLNDGDFVLAETIMSLDEISAYLTTHTGRIVGDCELIQRASDTFDLVENFVQVYAKARKIENIHTLTPRYLKDQDSYKVG